jgi:hypothetical protein
MNVIPCYKSVVEGKVTYLPVTTVTELKELQDIINKVQSSTVFGVAEQDALTVLRVFAYNLLNDVKGSN